MPYFNVAFRFEKEGYSFGFLIFENNNFTGMNEPSRGSLLIANPFLKDPNFLRTVVLICDHSSESGSFGFVLNKPFSVRLHQLLNEITHTDIPVSVGGPVQTDSLHFIHQYPDLIEGGEEILPGIYWGGNFESMKILLNNGDIDLRKVRFFLGYSGWSEGQLDGEIKEESWITMMGTRKLLFATPPEDVWKDSLKELGGDYEMMINFPLDPQLN